MSEAFAIDRDLTRMAHRFISETCDFLAENWHVQREWWPLRAGGRGGAPVSGRGATTGMQAERVVSPDEIQSIHVVSLHLDQSDAEDIGLAGTRLLVVVPAGCGTDMSSSQIRMVMAQVLTIEDEDPWQMWVPETIAPPSAAVRPAVRLMVAG